MSDLSAGEAVDGVGSEFEGLLARFEDFALVFIDSDLEGLLGTLAALYKLL